VDVRVNGRGVDGSGALGADCVSSRGVDCLREIRLVEGD
jgi:hypothetical protein